jgi:hypothetical protein
MNIAAYWGNMRGDYCKFAFCYRRGSQGSRIFDFYAESQPRQVLRPHMLFGALIRTP